MKKNKVFISYDYDTDSSFVNGIRGMIANDNIDIDFTDSSIIESIESTNADYIKSVIKPKISKSDIFLCIVGKNTHSSKWVKWEIKTAENQKLSKIIFMRRKDDNTSNIPGRVIYNWDIDYLKRI